VRLGLIARADARGLGIQTKAVHDNLRPAKTMVVDCPSAKPLPLRRDWFPEATWVHGLPTHGDFRGWLEGLTHVYTAETAYGYAFWDEAERAGVKTVLAVNPEFLDRHDRPSLWAAPSMWRYSDLPEPKCFLPVPISEVKASSKLHLEDADRRPKAYETATHFVHVIGRPATRDRNGTEDLLASLQYVTASVRVTITCQEAGYVENLVGRFFVPSNVDLVIKSGDVADNADLYRGQDVLIMPRRFGGLCLPLNEALGHGLPVIMPNISPNDSWLPADWLVPASWGRDFMVKGNRVDVYDTNPRALAEKIDTLASDAGFYLKAKTEALELRDQLSWTALKPLYMKTLEGVM
jgi:glycosyltransferase involved in cell wall biosynthesis